MKSYLILAVDMYLLVLSYSAPFRHHNDFTCAAESGMSLAKKILSDITAVHESSGLTLELSMETQNVEYLLSEIGIPAPPMLKAISDDFNLDKSLSHIAEGLELYHELLQEIRELLTSTENFNLLLADIRELSAQVHKMKQLAKIPSTTSKKTFTDLAGRLRSDYQIQVATYFSLKQLHSFTQDVFRSLRQMDVSK